MTGSVTSHSLAIAAPIVPIVAVVAAAVRHPLTIRAGMRMTGSVTSHSLAITAPIVPIVAVVAAMHKTVAVAHIATA